MAYIKLYKYKGSHAILIYNELLLTLMIIFYQLSYQITMPKMFTDNMVLQKKDNNSILGNTISNSNEKVEPSWMSNITKNLLKSTR